MQHKQLQKISGQLPRVASFPGWPASWLRTVFSFQNCKESFQIYIQIAHLFYKKKNLDDYFSATSSWFTYYSDFMLPFDYFTDITFYAYVEWKFARLIGFIDDSIHISIILGCSVFYVFILVEV